MSTWRLRGRILLGCVLVALAAWLTAAALDPGTSAPKRLPAAPAATQPVATPATQPSVACWLGGKLAHVDPISAARAGCIPTGGS